MEIPQYVSLGAGVQSSAMALMAAAGEISPMPRAAIFADTQAEPDSVYRWLDWLANELPFQVHRVTKGSLADAATTMRTSKQGKLYSTTDIPFFTSGPDGERGMISHRSCTADYKIKPIMKLVRQLADIKRGQKTVGVVQWIGISIDEFRRMKPCREAWAESRWPLIEKRMNRQSCLEWMEKKGYPEPPRSACVFCPFQSPREGRRLQTEEPGEFAKAVQFERDVQAAKDASDNMQHVPYLHRSCVPLDKIDFRSDIERGQKTLWDDECSGMCGS